MPADEPAIRVENLTKTYLSGENQLVVFANLNLAVRRGERLAIIGESGAGKSTFLHLLGGLDRPSSGKIYCGHREVTSLDDSSLAQFRNREIGFVWQTHYLLPEFTALENVMMPLLIRGAGPAEAGRAALEQLAAVGLEARASHQAGELSGGEQQRVVLARALAGRPGVLLADEPTGNLDYRTGDRIMDLIEERHRSAGLTTVLVTHNLCYARRCDRILQLEKGSLISPRNGESGAAWAGSSARENPPDLAGPSESGDARRAPTPGRLASPPSRKPPAGKSGAHRTMGEGLGSYYV